MLGMVLDLKVGWVTVKPERVLKLKQCICKLLGIPRPEAREIAQLCGYLLSMSVALGPVARLRTRALYSMLDSRFSWNSCLVWSEEALAECLFWEKMFDELHGQHMWRMSPASAVLTWSDASETGCGGGGGILSHKRFRNGERRLD